MADDVAGIFPARLTALTLERSPGDLDDVERGTLFVPWPTPPRVGARVQLDLAFGEDAPRRLEALVVASRPARGAATAGFKAAVLNPHADLLARLQGLAEVARARIVARAVDVRPADDGPIRERMSVTGRQPISREVTGRQPISREVTGRQPVLREPTGRHVVERLPDLPPRELTGRQPIRPPEPPPPPEPFAGGIDLPEDDGSELEMELPAFRPTPAPAANPRGARSVTDLELMEDSDASGLELDATPFDRRTPPPAPAPKLPPAPSFSFDAALDDDTSDLIAARPVLPPPRLVTPGPPRPPVSRPPPVAVRPQPPPEPIRLTIVNATTFQIHYERFLSKGLVYCAHASPPAPGSTVQVLLEAPVEFARLDVRVVVERIVQPPELPRAGFIGRLLDPDGAHADRLRDAAILLCT